MAPCRGEHLNRGRLTTLEHPRQVADHAPGSFGQSQLDRPAQILDDVTEPTLNRKDHDPTYGVCSHPYRQACSLEVA